MSKTSRNSLRAMTINVETVQYSSNVWIV